VNDVEKAVLEERTLLACPGEDGAGGIQNKRLTEVARDTYSGLLMPGVSWPNSSIGPILMSCRFLARLVFTPSFGFLPSRTMSGPQRKVSNVSCPANADMDTEPYMCILSIMPNTEDAAKVYGLARLNPRRTVS
jgi:hypothetical protein